MDMRVILFLIFVMVSTFSYSQPKGEIVSMDFVIILEDNKAEAIFYYDNNWKELRVQAIEKGYIKSYQLLESPNGKEFQLILVTTYQNMEQFNLREENFGKLIEARGDLKLLNDKQPKQFREIVMSDDMIPL